MTSGADRTGGFLALRRTTSLLILLGLAPVLLYVGFKGYLWYSIKSDVDAFRDLIAPLVQLDYRQIDVGWTMPSGPIGVRGITIKPLAVSEQIEIGSALIHTGDFRELYELAQSLRRDRAPDRLHLAVNRIVIDLDGSLGEWLNRQHVKNDSGSLAAAGCGRLRFSAEDLVAMGYQQLSNDVALQYRKDLRSGGLIVSGTIRTKDMVSVKFQATIPENEISLRDPRAMTGIPKLGTLSLSIQDLGYNENRNRFCAISLGVDKNQFVANHVVAVSEKLQSLGFDPSDELVSAYRSFVAKSGEFTLNLDPYEPIGVEDITTLSSQTLTERFGISVSYNDATIESLFTVPEVVEAEEEPDKPKIAPDTYKPTPVASLPQHINRQVKIYTADGKLHHAYLEGVGSEELKLTRHLVGGSATFSVAIADVTQVFVLY